MAPRLACEANRDTTQHATQRGGSISSSYTPATKSEKFDLVALAKGARSAVVSIDVFDDEHNSIGTGSGFFVSNDGLLVTNYHVIENASSAVVKTASGDQFSIKGAVYSDRTMIWRCC
jgi:Trypsin-like serine proteases, typically periplasmic, contain C-terminal PDZ domain